MLDLKNFQIREESYIPGRCNPGQNERRDFVTRIKSEKPEHVSILQRTNNCFWHTFMRRRTSVTACSYKLTTNLQSDSFFDYFFALKHVGLY
jgi:hypothetical protein